MAIATVIILATVIAVLAAYFGMQRVMSRQPDDRTNDLAGSVLFRISALHGLVLALVFASEIVEYQQLGFEISREVNAVSDIYYDAGRYAEDVEGIRASLRSYLRIVHAEEWSSLGNNGSLSGQAWAQWDAAYGLILDLAPASERQAALRENMLRKIHIIAESRDLREHHAASKLSGLFWFAALVGVLLVAAGYYSFPAKRDNLILIAFYAAYTGFIVFTIFAMSNPFNAPAAFDPVLFNELLIELES
jgi:hypothetical protein